MRIKLRIYESVWRKAHGGYVAEVRSDLDPLTRLYTWERLGEFPTRASAEAAILAQREPCEHESVPTASGAGSYCRLCGETLA